MDNTCVMINLDKQDKINKLNDYIKKTKYIYVTTVGFLYCVSFVSYILLFLYIASVLVRSENSFYLLLSWGITMVLICILIVILCQVDTYTKAEKLRDSISLNGLKLSADLERQYNEIAEHYLF